MPEENIASMPETPASTPSGPNLLQKVEAYLEEKAHLIENSEALVYLKTLYSEHKALIAKLEEGVLNGTADMASDVAKGATDAANAASAASQKVASTPAE
jgi:hypothetical protein